MYRGILLDFYGTLVHEDDDIIPVICETIRHHACTSISFRDIGQVWWTSFSSLFKSAYGAGFLSQREAARRSLVETLDHVGADLDPDTLLELQFNHWIAPPVFPDAKPFLKYLAGEGTPSASFRISTGLISNSRLVLMGFASNTSSRATTCDRTSRDPRCSRQRWRHWG